MDGTAPPSPHVSSQAWGLDVGMFVEASEELLLPSPELCTCRSAVLDYFTCLRSRVPDEHVLFSFKQQPGVDPVLGLLSQMCWEIGFPSGDDLGKYISGERGEVLDMYPELAIYRDVTFLWKWLCCPPNSNGVPLQMACQHRDMVLVWRWGVNGLEARALGGREMKITTSSSSDTRREGLLRMFMSSRPRTTVRGGTDPSVLCGTTVQQEEDVLHVPTLPNFGGRLSQAASERLLSFLTVPYLRIPLILDLLSSPEHLQSLAHPPLQRLLDCVLFEPSLWRPPTDQDVPQSVPAPDRAHLSTPCGLLLNELVHAPVPLLDALHMMLTHASELDTGRWTARAAAVILYVVRLVVRIDAFVTLLIRFNTCDHGAVNGTGWASSVRGLKADGDAVRACMERRTLLRQVLQLQIAPMLERWRGFALKAKDMQQVAVLHAHTSFLWRNVEQEDLTETVVVSLLSSQLILSSRFRPASWSKDVSTCDPDALDESELLLPTWELVALQQAKRGLLLRWLEADAQRKNQVLEKVVSVVAMATSGPNNRSQARHWRSIDGRHCVARYVPCLDQRSEEDQERAERQRDFVRGQEVGEIEVNVQLGTFSLNRSRLQGVDERMVDFAHFKQLFGDQGHLAQCAAVSITTKRVWMRMVGRRHDLILWKPDERAAAAPLGFTRRYPDSLTSSEAWISAALEQVRNQHDVLSDAKLLLPQNHYDSSAPFARVFGVRLVREETATILREGALLKLGGALSNKWNSRWFVLTPTQLSYYEAQKDVSNKQPRGSFKLSDIKEVGEVSDGPLELYLITQSGKTLHLRASHVGERDDWIKALAPKTCLVECVVLRGTGVVHMFEIFDEGRHKHRRLIFSSHPDYALHEMSSLYDPDASTGTLAKLACAAGTGHDRDFRVPRASQPSLVITRNLGTEHKDKQILVPSRLLQGLLPDALLDDFQFWQRSDLSLVGYQHVALRSRLQTAAVLRISIKRSGNAQAHALVQRVPLHNAVAGENVSPEQQWEEEQQLGSHPRDVVTLLDLVHAPAGSMLQRLGRMLARLDSLSHVLVWTKDLCVQVCQCRHTRTPTNTHTHTMCNTVLLRETMMFCTHMQMSTALRT